MDKFFKHKKDFLSSEDINIQSIIAVGKKLERDYLRFFSGLYKLYKKGERKNELGYIIGKIRRILTTINNIVTLGSINRKDIDKLLIEINEINESKEIFINEIKNTKALKERVEKITDETGISPEDLNITDDVIRESLSFAGRPRKPLSETMPKTHQIASDVMRGIKGAIFGPFSQLFDVAAGAFRDVRGLIKGRRGKLRGRFESDIARKLQPAAYVNGKFDPTSTNRLDIGDLSNIRLDKSVVVASLFSFFDKEAYKARWTREILSKISGLATKESKFSTGGIAAMTALAAAAGAIIFVGHLESVKAAALKEVGKHQKRELGFLDKYNKTVLNQIESSDLSESEKQKAKSELFKESGAVYGRQALERVPLQPLSKQFEAGRPKTTMGKIGAGLTLFPGIGLPVAAYEYLKMRKIERSVGESFKMKPVIKPVDKSLISPQPMMRGDVGESKTIDRLSKSIDELSESVRKDKELPNIRIPNTGVYDSADPFINMHAAGNLTLGE